MTTYILMTMMWMNDKLCPYCVNGETYRKRDLYNEGNEKMYIRIDGNVEKVYLENEFKKVQLDHFYYCPFCGRKLNGRRLGNRKFRGDK